MDDIEKIKNLIAEGEYFQAIGIDKQAKRLDIETASARLSEEYPELAAVIGGITQVITDPEKDEIYRIAYKFRDKVIQSIIKLFRGEFLEFVPDCRRIIWTEYQELLRCEFEKSIVKIGPLAATSLANRGQEWIIEAVVTRLPVFQPSNKERRTGKAVGTFQTVKCTKCNNSRYVSCAKCEGTGRIHSNEDDIIMPILTDDFDQLESNFNMVDCIDCNGKGKLPCDCRDTYHFKLPRDVKPGSVIIGVGVRTKKVTYAVFDHHVVMPRPTLALMGVYQTYNLKQNIGWLEVDLTLEYLESIFKKGFYIFDIGILLLSVMLGNFYNSWEIGLITSLPIIIACHINQRYLFRPSIIIANQIVAIFIPPILGFFLGSFFASWQIGVTIGVIMSLALIVLFGIGRLSEKLLR